MLFYTLFALASVVAALPLETPIAPAPLETSMSPVPLATPMAPVPAACLGFRLTSPTKTDQTWTYGQCYTADWDLGASQVTMISSVNLVDSKTGQVVATNIMNIPGDKGSTGHFPLLLGDFDAHEGLYFFQVIGETGVADKTCTLSSVDFYVQIDAHSPPETKCPA
jgi:hypothetical protein